MSRRTIFLSAAMLFVCSLCFLTGCGQEKPAFTNINRQHIVIIEPVAAGSRVAQLIKEAKTQKPQPSQQQ